MTKTYRIYGIASISKCLGTVEATTSEEAEEKAYAELSDEMSFSFCHQCIGEVGDNPCMDRLEAEEVK